MKLAEATRRLIKIVPADWIQDLTRFEVVRWAYLTLWATNEGICDLDDLSPAEIGAVEEIASQVDYKRYESNFTSWTRSPIVSS